MGYSATENASFSLSIKYKNWLGVLGACIESNVKLCSQFFSHEAFFQELPLWTQIF